MISYDEMVGNVYGRWTIQGIVRSGRSARFDCLCSCGKRKSVACSTIKAGLSQSCGCLRGEQVGNRSRTHGQTKTSTYRIWSGMVNRCTNKNNKDWKLYGGRGIVVCARWMAFENFLEDMGERPGRRHSIDRIDNSRGYEPGNCRWASDVEQANNRSNNHRVSWNGETRTVSEWARHLSISERCLWCRLNRGWSIEDALSTPTKGTKCPAQ